VTRGLGGVGAVVALVIAACGSTTQSAAHATATPAASMKPSAVDVPADDGARIVEVVARDERTRDITIESPAVGKQRARLLLPAGFETEPNRTWPVLYLLHGSDDPESFGSWTRYTDVKDLTAKTNLLVVMPEAGHHGYYSDWWNGGKGGDPMWETFHTVELLQLLERNWHAGERRAAAGLSMGGMGAMAYAARHPGMFVAAASYSGALDIRVAGVRDLATWGDPKAQASIWRDHNPTDLAPKLRGVALYVSYGDGRPGPFDSASEVDELEQRIATENEHFLARLEKAGIPATVDAYGPGTHWWPYWERALHRSLPLLLEALGEPH
jgi:diacylglycerol O-acyltransferase / trehalose O-mycolyltransferase